MLTNKSRTYTCSANYYGGNNARFEHNLTPRGRIDFSNPPAGYRYTAFKLEGDAAKDFKLDPMFITMHSFGGPMKYLCYMELVEEKLSIAIERSDRTAEMKNIRHNRCQIKSPKTGKIIMCPADGAHNCACCTLKDSDKIEPPRPLSLNALTYSDDDPEEHSFDTPAPVNIEAEIMSNFAREQIRSELAELDAAKQKKNKRGMHLAIYNLLVADCEFMEISRRLNIKKATLHDDLVRIARVVQKYID